MDAVVCSASEIRSPDHECTHAVRASRGLLQSIPCGQCALQVRWGFQVAAAGGRGGDLAVARTS
jgi:hypothetical protein